MSQFEDQAAKYDRDPLVESLYSLSHKRGAMKEKRFKNVESERLKHTYSKLAEELQRLKGPEWRKIIKADRNETLAQSKVRRDYYIKAIEGELAKQKRYMAEERKQKQARTERSQSPETMPNHTPPSETQSRKRCHSTATLESEIDTSARTIKKPRIAPKTKATVAAAAAPPAPVQQPKEAEDNFTSFYSKPHLRDAATQKWRKSARNITAFGLPLPDMPQRDYSLPAEWIAERQNLRKTQIIQRC